MKFSARDLKNKLISSSQDGAALVEISIVMLPMLIFFAIFLGFAVSAVNLGEATTYTFRAALNYYSTPMNATVYNTYIGGGNRQNFVINPDPALRATVASLIGNHIDVNKMSHWHLLNVLGGDVGRKYGMFMSDPSLNMNSLFTHADVVFNSGPSSTLTADDIAVLTVTVHNSSLLSFQPRATISVRDSALTIGQLISGGG